MVTNFRLQKIILRNTQIQNDEGYGAPEVATDLLVVGADFWLERCEYDGSEWWEFKQMPKCKNLPFKAITSLAVQQYNKNSDDCCCGWETLSKLQKKR